MGKIINLNLILRLTIWFLLTADLSLANIIIGVAIAFLLPGNRHPTSTFKDWLRMLGGAIRSIPQAYAEAIEIIVRPHNREEIIQQRVKIKRSPGLVFLDIFIITFTPKTIVVKYDKKGWYDIHRVKRK